jgi:peptidoglycan/LPS O-acetylase OafA/YrhL
MAVATDSRPAGQAARAPYFPLLDSLRGIAALGVFVLDAAFYVGISSGSGLAQYLVEHVSNYPAPSVVIFFGLSGFVLYRPFAARRLAGHPARSFTEYAVRRAARILPAYWVALAIVALVLNLHYVFSPTGLLRYYAFAQVYDQRTFQLGLPSAWSLDVDVAFYALLPLIVVLLGRLPTHSRASFLRTELGMCGCLYAASTLWQGLAVHTFLHQTRWFFPAELSLPGSLDIIVCGMALAVLSVACAEGEPGRLQRLLARAPWLPWLVALAAYVGIGQIPGSFYAAHPSVAWIAAKQLRCLIAVCALAPLIFGLQGDGLLRAILGSRPARFLGSISYAFYLWHWAVIEYLNAHHVQRHLGDAAFVAAALALSLALASASWYALERPASRAARRWLSSRTRLREPQSVLDVAA